MTASTPPRPYAALLFAVTIGVGACLLFQVQFILGKQVLPWFGGAPAVWTTCMLFFQVLLLLGYGYAHLLGSLPSPARQRTIHLAALGFAAALLLVRVALWPSPITPADTWKPEPGDPPVLAILGLLLFTIGPPFLVLSATGPLLQSWFSRCFPGASPYRLYALSNLGSLLGLVTYPFVLEPLLPLAGQGWAWSAGFLVFALGCAGTAVLVGRTAPTSVVPSGHVPSARPPTGREQALWFALATVASVMLLAVTSQISLEVAVIPFLWMLPLTLYLLSFVLTFEYERLYRPGAWIPLLLLGAGATAAVIRVGIDAPMMVQLGVYLFTLFAYCMVCHGELVARKPDPRHLTRFYLLVSAGGAAGGILCGVVAPALFLDLWELPLALLGGAVLAALLARRIAWPARRPLRRVLAGLMGLHLVALAGVLVWHAVAELDDYLHVTRGFFGVLKVDQDVGTSGELRTRLKHGRIIHGIQFADRDLARMPTSYYGSGSAVALAIRHHPRRLRGAPMNLGFVGLGAGTLATYAAPGDTVRFYEINPEVVALSTGDAPIFTYLKDSPGSVEVALGDARITLEREPSRQLDVLALDAFSSDAIPAHLLTVEAVGLYLRHLRDPGGVLAIHISNRYLDLDPVVRGLAQEHGLTVVRIDDSESNDMVWQSDWMLLARDPATLAAPEILGASTDPEGHDGPYPVWTDAYSNLLQVFKG